MNQTSSGIATSGVGGSIAILAASYLQHHGYTLDPDDVAALTTLAIAGSHGIGAIYRYAVSFFPQPKKDIPT